MKITAKFESACKACADPVRVGESVEWIKGQRGVTHLRCLPGAAEALAASRAASPDTAPAAQQALAATIPAPEGLEYLPYQRAGIAAALGRPATLFGDEMGLGKTVQVIGVSNADETIRRVLVFCPASLRLNWIREWARWSVRPMTAAIADTKALPDTDVVVVGWDSARKLRTLIDAREWDLVIVDEAHYGKNPKAARTKAVFGTEPKGRGAERKPGDPGIQARRKLALTGTPIPNRPVEIHPVLAWLDRGEWGSWFSFARRYAGAHQTRWGWDFSGATNLPELQQRLRSSVMIRRLKADVLTELPPKRRQVVEIAANGASGIVARERKGYEAHEDRIESLRAAAELAKAESDEAYAAAVAALSEAQQAAFGEISQLRHDTAVAKVPAILEHVTSALEADESSKVIVFAHHHDVIDALVDGLAEYGAVRLDGRMGMADRQASVDRFQSDPGCRVFVGGILAAGVGLTLTASSHVIFAELDWVPGNVTQAEDRAHRIGQTQSVLVQHLVLDGSIDARMAHILVEKQDVADRALDREASSAAYVTASRERAATETESRKKLDETAAKLTEEQIAEIHVGLRRLRAACDGAHNLDGQGFSAIDVRIGWSLADAPRLTRRQAALGLKLTTKYRRQLAA